MGNFDDLKLIDFRNICRICLQTGDLIQLCQVEANVLSVLSLFKLQEIHLNDLPQSICQQCIEYLRNICTFIETYITNTKRLCDALAEKKSHLPVEFNNQDEEDTNSYIKELKITNLEDDHVERTDSDTNADQLNNSCAKKSRRNVKCDICRKVFSRTSGLQRHMKIHLGVKPFKCPICGKTFVEKATLNRHNLTHSGSKPFGCSLCGKFARRKDQIAEHIQKHHPNVKDVDFVIIQQDDMQEKTGGENATEEIDEKVDNKPSELTRTKKRVEICQCTLCGKVFQRRDYLKNHMAIHAAIKPYQCAICSKGFTQRHALTRHNLVHTKERPFQCNLCGKTFTRKEILTEHIKNHDSNGGSKRYLCFHCGKCFENKFYLSKHLRYHLVLGGAANRKQTKSSNGRKCICPHCGKQLHSPSYLKVHLLTHSGEKPFECNICGNRFTVQSSLKHHLNIHKGIKPYPCKLCDKVFRTSSSLKKHQLLHSGERPYKCTSCNKAFIRGSHLKRHSLIH